MERRGKGKKEPSERGKVDEDIGLGVGGASDVDVIINRD